MWPSRYVIIDYGPIWIFEERESICGLHLSLGISLNIFLGPRYSRLIKRKKTVLLLSSDLTSNQSCVPKRHLLPIDSIPTNKIIVSYRPLSSDMKTRSFLRKHLTKITMAYWHYRLGHSTFSTLHSGFSFFSLPFARSVT